MLSPLSNDVEFTGIYAFNQKSQISGFSKSLSETSKNQDISTVLCTSERGQMTKLDKVETYQNCGVVVLL